MARGKFIIPPGSVFPKISLSQWMHPLSIHILQVRNLKAISGHFSPSSNPIPHQLLKYVPNLCTISTTLGQALCLLSLELLLEVSRWLRRVDTAWTQLLSLPSQGSSPNAAALSLPCSESFKGFSLKDFPSQISQDGCALRGLSLLSPPSASHAAQPCSLPSRPTGLSSVPWRWDDLSAPGLWLMPLPLPALAAFKPLLPGSSKSQHGFWHWLPAPSRPPAFQEGLPWVSHSTAKAGQQARVPAMASGGSEPELPAGEAVPRQTAGARWVSGGSAECLAQPVSLPSVP